MLRIGSLIVALSTMVLGSAQQSAQLDFFATVGELEMDYDRDGIQDSFGISAEPPAFREQVNFRINFSDKVSGAGSQEISFSRASGVESWLTFYRGVNFDAALAPAADEVVLVRLSYYAQDFNNARYWISVHSGDNTFPIVPITNSATGGWQTRSLAVPIRVRANGERRFFVEIGIRTNAGAAQGLLRVDNIQVLSMRTVTRSGALPNGLKIAVVNPQHDPYRDLADIPVRAIIDSRSQLGVAAHATVYGRHYPDTLIAQYVMFSSTITGSYARHNRDIYNYDDMNQNHPNWFLRNAAGERMTMDNGVTYYVDVGIPEVRERAWQNLRDFLLRAGRPRYVYFDDVDMRVGENAANYGNINSWAQAVVDALNYIGSRMRAEFGATIIPNSSWSPGFWLRGMNGGPDGPGVATLPNMGGFLIEHIFTHARTRQNRTTTLPYGTTRDLNDWQVWTLRDKIRLATEYPDKIIILHPTYVPGLADTQQRIRFAVAGCLIVQHENTYVEIEPRSSSGVQYPNGYYPPEMFVPLGRWTENFRILNGDIVTGGLFVRNYENGIVVLNPTHDRDFTFTVPRDLYDWDRNLIRAGTVVNIPRQTGHVFYSSPEITLELSPQNAQVLPGQTVQFTVTYRNRGTAPGANVRIAVPLPQGMTLVGSNPIARLENGQVVWIVPNVPVGGQGTLQFTVRVE